MAIEIRIQETDFSITHEWDALRARIGGGVGAVASFVGLVREQDQESQVTSLYLEHYPGMTEESIRTIVAQAETRWELVDVVVVHRVGHLAAKDQIVFVQVAAGHRTSAFAACEFIMDYLKTDAVLWKREATRNVQRWLEASDEDRKRVENWRADKS